MIKGMHANLVNSPSIKNKEQKNSAKIIKEALTVVPIPSRLGTCCAVTLKWVIF